MPSILRAIALTALVLISSCHAPEIGTERARDYFAAHRAVLDAVVEQVQLCQPDASRIDAQSNFRCTSSAATASNVLSAMAAANAQWIRVNYNQREGEPRVLASILIAMQSSFGTSFAGRIEAFVFETAGASEANYERIDYRDGAFREQLPLTGAPHHWYWRRIDR